MTFKMGHLVPCCKTLTVKQNVTTFERNALTFFSFAVSPVLTLCKTPQILFINLFYVKSIQIKSKNMDSMPRLTVF